MAVVLLSSSGNVVRFVDDVGQVFTVSRSYLEKFIKGEAGKSPFIVLTRFPRGVSPSRYPPSPVFDPETRTTVKADQYNWSSVDKTDVMSAKEAEKRKEVKVSEGIKEDKFVI